MYFGGPGRTDFSGFRVGGAKAEPRAISPSHLGSEALDRTSAWLALEFNLLGSTSLVGSGTFFIWG